MSEEELHLGIYYYISVCVCVCVCVYEIDTWQRVVISLDTFQSLVLKIMEVYWNKSNVSSYIQRCKGNSTNKF